MKVYTAIGVTATRDGLSQKQKEWLQNFLKENKACGLHHGDCKGGDEEVAEIFSEHGSYIVAFPGTSTTLRAYCSVNNMVRPVAENLVRNRRIARSVDLMLAFPNNPIEKSRSGTWYTVRYTRKYSIPLIIVNPDGTESK